MSEQSGTAGKSAGGNTDADSKTLGVEDIPGAVMPEQAGSKPAGGGLASLNDRLQAFRDRRAGAGGGAGGGQGGGPGGGGRARGQGGQGQGPAGGVGAGQGRGRGARVGGRPGAGDDPIAAAKKVLEQLNKRAETAGEEKRGLKFAIQNIQNGFQALEKEIERLRGELARAHEAVRSVQGQGD
jgi:hypothetical protein